MFQETLRLKNPLVILLCLYGKNVPIPFLGITSVKFFCLRRTSERRINSFYLFLLFHIYLQAHAVDKNNIGLIALEMMPYCICGGSLPGLWSACCCTTHSSPWSAVALAGFHPRPTVLHRLLEVRVMQPVKKAQTVCSFCLLLLGKVVL